MKVLYFDCFSGVSGDMILGAFLDAGIDSQYLQDELAKLSISEFSLEINKVQKRGITGTCCKVLVHSSADMDKHVHAQENGHIHKHRHLSDIRKILEESSLAEEVKKTALAIFLRVAQAEAKVHGMSVEEVHFHEVGAVDSIVDIVGAAICFHQMNANKIYCSAMNVGKGTVYCAHGLLPVPAPAVLEILADSEIPLYSNKADGETATPTGTAILSEMAKYTKEIPLMNLQTVGYGFGQRDFEMLNGLRLLVGNI